MKKKTYIHPVVSLYHITLRPLLAVSISKNDEPAEKITTTEKKEGIWGDYWGGGDAM